MAGLQLLYNIEFLITEGAKMMLLMQDIRLKRVNDREHTRITEDIRKGFRNYPQAIADTNVGTKSWWKERYNEESEHWKKLNEVAIKMNEIVTSYNNKLLDDISVFEKDEFPKHLEVLNGIMEDIEHEEKNLNSNLDMARFCKTVVYDEMTEDDFYEKMEDFDELAEEFYDNFFEVQKFIYKQTVITRPYLRSFNFTKETSNLN